MHWLSALGDWLMSLQPAVAAAIVGATVSLLTATLTLFLAPSVKYAFDQRMENRKLEILYRFEQRKALKDHIARHLGHFLEAADSLSNRFKNYEHNSAKGWLNMRGLYFGTLGYYSSTFAYRLLRCLGTIRSVQREAIYIDTTIAAVHDQEFLKALKLNITIWTDVRLFEGLAYDDSEAADHFFRDALSSMADLLFAKETPMPFVAFQEAVSRRDHPYIEVFKFFDDVKATESRFRHDRIVCAHIVMAATLNAFGYDYQASSDQHIRDTAGRVQNQAVLENLCTMVEELKLMENHEFARTARLLRER